MFKLIHNRQKLIQEASTFVFNEMPDIEVDVYSVLRMTPSNNFPYLMDMMVAHDWNGEKVFNSHVCTKKIAKYLIYPKTNKIDGRMPWFIMHNIADIPNVLNKSPLYGRKSEIVMTSGFDEEVRQLAKGEPFLISAKGLFRAHNKFKTHISIVTYTKAKRLVYYKKETPIRHGSPFIKYKEIYI